jgi:hypothetical protein
MHRRRTRGATVLVLAPTAARARLVARRGVRGASILGVLFAASPRFTARRARHADHLDRVVNGSERTGSYFSTRLHAAEHVLSQNLSKTNDPAMIRYPAFSYETRSVPGWKALPQFFKSGQQRESWSRCTTLRPPVFACHETTGS